MLGGQPWGILLIIPPNSCSHYFRSMPFLLFSPCAPFLKISWNNRESIVCIWHPCHRYRSDRHFSSVYGCLCFDTFACHHEFCFAHSESAGPTERNGACCAITTTYWAAHLNTCTATMLPAPLLFALSRASLAVIFTIPLPVVARSFLWWKGQNNVQN